MNKNVEYYKKVMNSMIKKSFPTLRKKKIIVIEFNSKKYSGGAYNVVFGIFIGINKELRKDNKKLIGVLAHELGYLEVFVKKKGWKHVLDGLFYWTSSKKRTKNDKDTDRSAIRKGYAKELYYFKKHKKKSKMEKYYLSANEIKEYAKKIGKW